jgi:hypothetical protein
MNTRVLVCAAILTLSLEAKLQAAQAFIGTWQLDHQELNGEKKDTEQLILRISPDGDKFLFAFSVPVNDISFVSLSYSAKLDGSEADVKNARGSKVGTVQLTSPSPAHYTLIMKGDKRPATTVHLIVSADGKTLTSQSDSSQAGKPVRLVQTFLRH